jgi:uncharacterized membrane protein
VWPHLTLLLVAQAVLFAASVVPVWLFARRALGVRAAYLVAAGYGLAWGLQTALAVDVHEVMFAPLLVAIALERAQARRPLAAVAAAGLLLLVKEDFGLFLAVFGGYLALLGWRRIGLLTALLGIAGFAVETWVLIPYFAGGHPYAYFTSPLGGGLGAALRSTLRDPLRTIRLLGWPRAKLDTLFWLLAPWGFLGLVSPIAVLAVPLLLERFLGSNPFWWGTAHQYNAALMPVAACAGVDGLRRLLPRLNGWSARVVTGWTVGALVIALVTAAIVFPFGRLLHGSEWQTTSTMRAADAALAHVPAGVTVEADTRLGPHLADRDTVWLLDQTPRYAPWVVAGTDAGYWPFRNERAVVQRLALLERQGYSVVWDRAGFVVLHRTGMGE